MPTKSQKPADQTEAQWLATYSSVSQGTGLYLNENADNLDYELDIEYKPFAAFVATTVAIALKWVPHEIATFDELKKVPCKGFTCTATCVQPGCVCDPIRKICIGL